MNNSFDIIVTIWNRLAHTKRTLGTLVASGALERCDRLIIVDNLSTEEGMAEFLAEFPALSTFPSKVFILKRPKNDGWACAVNDAIGLSRAQNLLILNNDVELHQGFDEKMFVAIDAHPEIGIVGGWRHTAHGFSGLQTSCFREMDNVPAVAWMIQKRAMRDVGMLEEHGPCLTKGGNGEDTAYVMAMKANGWLVGVTGEDVVTHIDGY